MLELIAEKIIRNGRRCIDSYAFPIAIGSNMFSMSAFLVLLGLIGKVNIAADVGLVQAATAAIFFAFSANARNLILRDGKGRVAGQLLIFRFFTLPVLAFISYLLSVGVADVKGVIVVALLGRRCAEWIAELHISESERIGELKFGYRFITIQAGSFFLIAIAIILEYSAMVIAGLTFWAISPILLSFQFLANGITKNRLEWKSTWKIILPHLGSSWVIGLSTYLFRLLLLLLVGKAIAGLLFSAYAGGGMLNSIYTYALGPSLVLQKFKTQEGHTNRNAFIVVTAIALIGLVMALWACSATIQPVDPANQSFFWFVFGISMIGAGVMILAQRTRLYLLQLHQSDDVVAPDVLANILIIASVPFAYYLFGYAALPYLFLWNAVVNWVFYQLALAVVPYGDGYDYYTSATKDNTMIKCLKMNRHRIQVCVLVLICLPVFFQLSGSIFNAKDIIYDTQGSLFFVPLPLSVLACFLGLIFMLRYDLVKITVGFLFSFFLIMVFSTFVIASAEKQLELDKMIFLIQFILPVFGLILGHSYQEPDKKHLRFEVIFFSVIAIIVPLELIASWIQKYLILSPYIYFFSIYQHLQYVPVIIVSLYFLSLAVLFEYNVGRKLLFLLAPFIGIYAAASISALAMLIALSGSVLSVIFFLRRGLGKSVLILTMLVLVPLLLYAFMLRTNPTFHQKFQSLIQSQRDTIFAQRDTSFAKHLPNISERIYYWKYYLTGITENPKTFFLGHEKRPDRDKYPSAHNYYLDLVYNYGLISLFPFLFLIAYTFIKLKNRMRYGPMPLDLIALALVVLFFVLVDSSLKVGFRQPYPGIIMFFLWGVLLTKLAPHTEDKNKISQVVL